MLHKLVSTYRSKRKVSRWPVALCANMLDVSAYNALVIYLTLNPKWNFVKKSHRRRLFLIEFGNALVQPYIEKRSFIPRAEHALSVVSEIQGIQVEPPPASEAGCSSVRCSRARLEHVPRAPKRARCHMCPKTSTANLHGVRCDGCRKPTCPTHRFNICAQCEKRI